jgi:hypothetical protein
MDAFTEPHFAGPALVFIDVKGTLGVLQRIAGAGSVDPLGTQG